MIYEPRAKYITNTEIANPDFIFSTIDVILVKQRVKIEKHDTIYQRGMNNERNETDQRR